MQQITDLRRRWGDREQWVRIGVLSASVIAPLLSRWNELRASERSRELRAQAEARLRNLRESMPRSRRGTQRQIDDIVRQVTDVPDAATARETSSKLWLVGVLVGLAAAGGTAYVIARRQLRLRADEPLVELQMGSSNGHRAIDAQDALNGRSSRDATATSAAPASANGVAATLAEQAATPEAAAPEAIPGPASAPAEYGAAQDVPTAAFIGNIHTLVYHDAGADPAELPAEENRIYFLTEDDARARGYRRDRAEIAPEEVASSGEAEGQTGVGQ